MFEIEPKRLKFLGILVFLLLTFCLFVGNAYKYIPEQNNEINLQKEIFNVITEEKNVENVDKKDSEEISEETTEDSSNKKDLYQNIDIPSEENLIPIEELSSNKKDANIVEIDVFTKVKEYKKQQDYSSAVAELKKVLEASSDEVVKSQCYEELAVIHGIDKHYGTALAYAQKAYNMYPTTNREVLLARLYYKTGDTEKANNRINNVLKRDFWADR